MWSSLVYQSTCMGDPTLPWLLWQPCLSTQALPTKPLGTTLMQRRVLWIMPTVLAVRFLNLMDTHRHLTIQSIWEQMMGTRKYIFLIMELNKLYNGLLGMPWIRGHTHLIDWTNYVLEELSIATTKACKYTDSVLIFKVLSESSDCISYVGCAVLCADKSVRHRRGSRCHPLSQKMHWIEAWLMIGNCGFRFAWSSGDWSFLVGSQCSGLISMHLYFTLCNMLGGV